jgi:hypothetical protein
LNRGRLMLKVAQRQVSVRSAGVFSQILTDLPCWSERQTEGAVRLFCPVPPPDLDAWLSPEAKLPPQPVRELRVDMRELVYNLPEIKFVRQNGNGKFMKLAHIMAIETVGAWNAS